MSAAGPRPRALRGGPRLLLALTLLALTSQPALAAGARFHQLTGPQIRTAIIGRAVTDDVHWIEEYRPHGVLYMMGMGRESTGSWRIEGDRLCSVKRLDGDVCYQVWLRGRDVQFRITAEVGRYEGRLKPIRHGR